MLNTKLVEFFEFIYDRQLIWYKKSVLKSPAPWTDNPILQTYKFCNIYRELDRVSLKIIQTICHNTLLSFERKLFNIVSGRIFNLDTIYSQLLGVMDPDNYDHKYYEDILDNKIKEGISIWNSAYTVTQMKYDPSYRKDKHAQFLLMLQFFSKNIGKITEDLRNCSSLREATLKITNVPLIGEFLGGEIIQDLTYCRPFFFKNNMLDDHDLCTVGPGTLKSITETFDLQKTSNDIFSKLIKSTTDSQAQYFEYIKNMTGKDWESVAYRESNSPFPYLSINNIESAFCEKRKYNNLLLGEGRKRYYKES